MSACKNNNDSIGRDAKENLNYSIEELNELKVKIRISKQPTLLSSVNQTFNCKTLSQSDKVTDMQTQAQNSLKLAGFGTHDTHAINRESILSPFPTRRLTRSKSICAIKVNNDMEQYETNVDMGNKLNQKLITSDTAPISYHPSNSSSSDKSDKIKIPSKRKLPSTIKIMPTSKCYIGDSKVTNKVSESPKINVIPSIRNELLTPGLQSLNHFLDKSHNQYRNDVQIIKESLHVSAVPQSLPCRETEFQNIKSFIERKILDSCSGCMYVSGVPGTGKTATITEVIRSLQMLVKQLELPDFKFVSINGMKVTDPRQAYVEINRQLTGHKLSHEQALKALEHRFSRQAESMCRKTTVLLVDELDILCNRRQDVVYNILDWPTKMASRLVVVTIANTMDLPERLLMGKVTSRMGLTRLTFQPYSHKQLQEVVMARLAGSDLFRVDAVQLVARKVASVSGDCRRALDICRRSIEIAETEASRASCENPSILVSMVHVQKAFTEMISSCKVQAIKACSQIEQAFLKGIEAEVTRTGVEETTFIEVYTQFESILRLMGFSVPSPGRAMILSSRLGSSKLIITDFARNDIYQKILLNVSADDIHYALHQNL